MLMTSRFARYGSFTDTERQHLANLKCTVPPPIAAPELGFDSNTLFIRMNNALLNRLLVPGQFIGAFPSSPGSYKTGRYSASQTVPHIYTPPALFRCLRFNRPIVPHGDLPSPRSLSCLALSNKRRSRVCRTYRIGASGQELGQRRAGCMENT